MVFLVGSALRTTCGTAVLGSGSTEGRKCIFPPVGGTQPTRLYHNSQGRSAMRTLRHTHRGTEPGHSAVEQAAKRAVAQAKLAANRFIVGAADIAERERQAIV